MKLRQIEVCQHTINFYVNDPDGNPVMNELPEYDVDHIAEMIKEGFHTGEIFASIFINDDDNEPTECHGWWSINGKGMVIG